MGKIRVYFLYENTGKNKMDFRTDSPPSNSKFYERGRFLFNQRTSGTCLRNLGTKRKVKGKPSESTDSLQSNKNILSNTQDYYP